MKVAVNAENTNLSCTCMWFLYAIVCYMTSPVHLSVCLSVRPYVRHMGGSVRNGWS